MKSVQTYFNEIIDSINLSRCNNFITIAFVPIKPNTSGCNYLLDDTFLVIYVRREIRGIDVDDHPAIGVREIAREVSAATERGARDDRVSASHTPDTRVQTHGVEAAAAGAAGVRAEHAERRHHSQQQIRERESARGWRCPAACGGSVQGRL